MSREDDGPSFAAAGTVFPGPNEPDDCYGVAGVTVEIADADGALYSTETNEAGNFYLLSEEVTLALPFSVRMLYQGRERRMLSAQAIGACNSCHTETGANLAPGRILVP